MMLMQFIKPVTCASCRSKTPSVWPPLHLLGASATKHPFSSCGSVGPAVHMPKGVRLSLTRHECPGCAQLQFFVLNKLQCWFSCFLRTFEDFEGRTLRVSILNSSLRRITTSGVRVDDSPSSLNSSLTDTSSAWAPHVCNSACDESHCLHACWLQQSSCNPMRPAAYMNSLQVQAQSNNPAAALLAQLLPWLVITAHLQAASRKLR